MNRRVGRMVKVDRAYEPGSIMADQRTDRQPTTGPMVSARAVGSLPGPVRTTGVQLGEMTKLGLRVCYSAIRHPKGYWRDSIEQSYLLLKAGALPMFAMIGLFSFLVTSVAYGLLESLGSEQRMAQFVLVIGVREMSAFLAGVVAAGVMGTAVTADLGSQVIREEISALRVLGFNPERMLVLPRMIALTFMTVLLAVFSVSAAIVCGYLVGPIIGGMPASVFWENLNRNTTVPDLFGMLAKGLVIGTLIAIVHCYKGLSTSGGPEAVGRAVNQAVVISVIGQMVVTLTINAFLQGTFPEVQVSR